MTLAAAVAEAPKREVLRFELFWGLHGLLQLINRHDAEFSTVLDIGAGAGEHSRFFRLYGKKTYSVDLHKSADYVGDFMTCDIDRKFDVVWCSHVLEHQRNVGAFLEKIYSVLEDDGLLAISVPMHPRERMVSGHITNWNAGLLIYNLVLAGFDCRQASFYQSFDLSLIVRKRPAAGGDVLTSAGYAPVEELAQYFPFPVMTGSNAEIKAMNWNANYKLKSLGRPVTLEFTADGNKSASINVD